MTLNLDAFNEGSKKKSNNKYKAALGVGSVVSLFGFGSTLAANISLNGGGNVEFGQGVATTAACDEDGFTITPVTRYDNNFSIFRVDYVEVSGVDLTPEGTGYGLSGSGVVDQNNDATVDQSDAKEQFPGQYFDGTDWKRTCDNVVLDFKAYTDDEDYALYTDDAYTNPTNTLITSPLGWINSFDGAGLDYSRSPGFALIIDSADDGSDYEDNHAIDAVINNTTDWHGNPNDVGYWAENFGSSWTTSNATFKFGSWSDFYNPNASAISKITVQSMKEFPRSYYADHGGLGNPSAGW